MAAVYAALSSYIAAVWPSVWPVDWAVHVHYLVKRTVNCPHYSTAVVHASFDLVPARMSWDQSVYTVMTEMHSIWPVTVAAVPAKVKVNEQ
jgi:hypothetical protein